MSHEQTPLGNFASQAPATKAGHTPTGTQNGQSDRQTTVPKLGFEDTDKGPSTTPSGPFDAINLDYVLWTGRYPYAFDAARLGYGIGHREDSSYQWTPDGVDLSTQFLDNHFQNPDLDRFVDEVFETEPDVAVIGDVEDEASLDAHLNASEEVWNSYPKMQLILVPKCRPALEDIPEKFILGYPNGKSEIKAADVAPPETWRGRDLHILGGTPLQTWEQIEALTRPSITGDDPANIVGIDSNVCLERALNRGIYRKATGGEARHLRADYTNKRALVLYSLLNIKHFWVERGVWPTAPDPTRDPLPNRDRLLDALGVRSSSATPTHHYSPQRPAREDELGIKDLETLATSPKLYRPPTETPSIRTDETQAAVKEPCIPTPFNSTRNYEPDGCLRSTSASFRPEYNLHAEPICLTCGGDLFDPYTCHGYTRSANGPGESIMTAEVVSYDHEHTNETNHYGSVAKDAASSCTQETPGKVITFCSSGCRRRGEARLPDLAPEGEQFPDPNILQRVKIHPDRLANY
jgi:hypothetical protein